MQAYEILSLYLELIAVRSQLIAKTKEIPRDMVEAISSVIYAAQVSSSSSPSWPHRTSLSTCLERAAYGSQGPSALAVDKSVFHLCARACVCVCVRACVCVCVCVCVQRIADVPELASLRSLFAQKYSKEYAAEASSDVTCNKWQVNQNLINCLLVRPYTGTATRDKMPHHIHHRHGQLQALTTQLRCAPCSLTMHNTRHACC